MHACMQVNFLIFVKSSSIFGRPQLFIQTLQSSQNFHFCERICKDRLLKAFPWKSWKIPQKITIQKRKKKLENQADFR